MKSNKIKKKGHRVTNNLNMKKKTAVVNYFIYNIIIKFYIYNKTKKIIQCLPRLTILITCWYNYII